MPLVGIHQGFYGLRELVTDCVSLGNNTFQCFIRNNRNMRMRKFYDNEIQDFNSMLFNAGILRYVVHASYALNPASYVDSIRENSLKVIKEDLQLMNRFGGKKYYVLHPGAHTDNYRTDALRILTLSMLELRPYLGNVTVCLETMAGQGSQLFSTLHDMRLVMQHLDEFKLCVDTCHLYGAGITVEEFVAVFDDKIGVIHVNDSLRKFGTHLDRHASIGYGCMSDGMLERYVSRLHGTEPDAPLILETPYEHVEEDLIKLKSIVN